MTSSIVIALNFPKDYSLEIMIFYKLVTRTHFIWPIVKTVSTKCIAQNTMHAFGFTARRFLEIQKHDSSKYLSHMIV